MCYIANVDNRVQYSTGALLKGYEVMDEHKRISRRHFRVGGYHCRCCGPAHSERKFYRKMVRRVLKQEDRKLFADE